MWNCPWGSSQDPKEDCNKLPSSAVARYQLWKEALSASSLQPPGCGKLDSNQSCPSRDVLCHLGFQDVAQQPRACLKRLSPLEGVRPGRLPLTLGLNMIVFGSRFFMLVIELTVGSRCRPLTLTARTNIFAEAAGSHGGPSLPGTGPTADHLSLLGNWLKWSGPWLLWWFKAHLSDRWVFSHILLGADTGWLNTRQERKG